MDSDNSLNKSPVQNSLPNSGLLGLDTYCINLIDISISATKAALLLTTAKLHLNTDFLISSMKYLLFH